MLFLRESYRQCRTKSGDAKLSMTYLYEISNFYYISTTTNPERNTIHSELLILKNYYTSVSAIISGTIPTVVHGHKKYYLIRA